MHVFKVGDNISILDIQSFLIDLRYERNELDFARGTFRVRGNAIDVYPSYEDVGIRLVLGKDTINEIQFFDEVSGELIDDYHSFTSIIKQNRDQISSVAIYPAKHYVFSNEKIFDITNSILSDMSKQVEKFKEDGRMIEPIALSKSRIRC